MTGDDRPDYGVSQQRHAEKIRTERNVMNMTGLSRSALRSLTKFQAQVQARQAERAKAAERAKSPEVTTTPERNFYPKPIVTEARGGKAAPPVGEINNVIMTFSGTSYYCVLNGEVGAEV